jgi:hypothetical protein
MEKYFLLILSPPQCARIKNEYLAAKKKKQ